MNSKKNKFKDIIYTTIIIILLGLLIINQVDKSINILSHSDWVTLYVGMLTFIGTIVLGTIAIHQNIKTHSINDRLLKIEENKNKTYLIFKNGNALAFPPNDEIWKNEKYAIDLSKSIVINATNSLDDNSCTLINPKISFIGDRPLKSINVSFIRIMQKNFETRSKVEILLLKLNKENPINFIYSNGECNGYISLPIGDINKYINEKNQLEVSLYITAKNIFDISTDYALQFTLSNIKQNTNNLNCYHVISRIVNDI